MASGKPHPAISPPLIFAPLLYHYFSSLHLHAPQTHSTCFHLRVLQSFFFASITPDGCIFTSSLCHHVSFLLKTSLMITYLNLPLFWVLSILYSLLFSESLLYFYPCKKQCHIHLYYITLFSKKGSNFCSLSSFLCSQKLHYCLLLESLPVNVCYHDMIIIIVCRCQRTFSEGDCLTWRHSKSQKEIKDFQSQG